jgi:hypothetical protein
MGRRVIEQESDEESYFSAEESDDEERPSPGRSASRSGADGGSALRPIAAHTPMELMAGGIAGVSVATSVAAMIIQPVNIVFAAGGLSW